MYGMIGHDLFGEERGQVSLSNITKARILDEDMEEFELKVVECLQL